MEHGNGRLRILARNCELGSWPEPGSSQSCRVNPCRQPWNAHVPCSEGVSYPSSPARFCAAKCRSNLRPSRTRRQAGRFCTTAGLLLGGKYLLCARLAQAFPQLERVVSNGMSEVRSQKAV